MLVYEDGYDPEDEDLPDSRADVRTQAWDLADAAVAKAQSAHDPSPSPSTAPEKSANVKESL